VIVVKFGGTSVGDAAAIGRAAEIVRGRMPGARSSWCRRWRG
jgi:aspartokinase